MNATMAPGNHRSNRRTAVLAIMGAVLVSVALGPWTAFAAAEDVAGLDRVGTLVRPDDFFLQRPMAVDERRSLGFVTNGGGAANLHMLDLERLVEIDAVDEGRQDGYSPESNLALDPDRERIYAVSGYPGTTGFNTACSGVPGLIVFDYGVKADGRRTIERKRMGPVPCAGSVQFSSLTSSYDDVSDRLYLGGVPATERWRQVPSDQTPVPSLAGGTLEEDRGQTLLLRQLKVGEGDLVPVDDDPAGAAQLTVEWEVDLRLAGCGRREQVSSALFEGFVARLGNDILAYCWDARAHSASAVGQQGYLVRIPLQPDSAGVMKPATRGAPLTDASGTHVLNYVFRRVPTLPGAVTPILDAKSGRVLLVTTGRTNGNAVWVFDPRAERFVGVITGGYSDERPGNTAVGFDSQRGRAYVLTQNGILVASIRGVPLPAGIIYPTLANTTGKTNFVSSNRIGVAPSLGRLFVAMNDNNDDPNSNVKILDDHYEVLEDRIPDPVAPVTVSPDSLTTQIDEEEGTTSASTSGQAITSGLHVVNTGGLPRVVGQNDPLCLLNPPNTQQKPSGERQDAIPSWEIAPALFGTCVPEALFTPGHREGSLADVHLESGTGSGATVRAAAFAVGSTDSGTDGDVRRFSDCGAATPDQANQWGRRWPLPDDARLTGSANNNDDSTTAIIGGRNKREFVDRYNSGRDEFWGSWAEQREEGQADYRGGCNELQSGVAGGGGPDLRAGTKGVDGKGFPVPAAVCGDFGGAPGAEAWPDDSGGRPQIGYPTSSASCDASGPAAAGQASAGAMALPSAADSQIAVARASSHATSRRTAEGHITVAYSSVAGVQFAVPNGALTISEIRSLAVTKAAGRTGSASILLIRQWCGIAMSIGDATSEQPGCIDAASKEAADLLHELSAAFLQKIQFTVPQAETQATPGGYQAVVTKHFGQRGADQTVNDDDSHTVSALQAIIYNDGPKGRSRLVVQLAGVHAESRYGIIELPNFGGGFEPEPGPATEPSPEPGPVPDPGPAPAPPVPPDPFTPETFFEEDFGVGPEEFVRFSQPPSRTVTVPTPGGNPLQQIVRVPVRALSDAINLLVQNPREAALLFVTWALLAAPVYLGLRRRSFAQALTG